MRDSSNFYQKEGVKILCRASQVPDGRRRASSSPNALPLAENLHNMHPSFYNPFCLTELHPNRSGSCVRLPLGHTTTRAICDFLPRTRDLAKTNSQNGAPLHQYQPYPLSAALYPFLWPNQAHPSTLLVSASALVRRVRRWWPETSPTRPCSHRISSELEREFPSSPMIFGNIP